MDSLDNQVEAVEHHRRQRLNKRRVALEAARPAWFRRSQGQQGSAPRLEFCTA